MNGTDQFLLNLARSERGNLGYLTDETRDRLYDTGMTAAEIEAALNNMETTK